jgi:RNA polymerase sigma factor (sigma-70 family)
MYNVGTMLSEKAPVPDEQLPFLDPIKLFHLCAEERENAHVWTEFLNRYSDKLKQFIYGALRQFIGSSIGCNGSFDYAGIQEDLFQNTIIRLVENNCAAMRRFSGGSEKELLAYLAVICRSSVLDSLRHNNALKRKSASREKDQLIADGHNHQHQANHMKYEREILGRELMSLTRESIDSNSGPVSGRDHLVFKLHFFDGLSYNQIAQCEGINLSKAGVEKLLKRLVGRVQDLVLPGKGEGAIQ